ncbi:neuropeptide-like protein 29 [Bicyclus anynana]|uniref:Neuropeptide-like protein 29 n=1 Tax=Bicyclus anynana TaxID=110368 RepID=A0A6J1NZW1_BICAN|nr:neuropeptide-like protein 29 [Bicyclus anynana]
MKATLCVLLLVAAAVCGAEQKKNEKRGLLGLGYGGLGYGGLGYGGWSGGHGLGLYGGHGLGLYGGHGLGLYGGHVSAPIVSHSVAIPAPVISHSVAAPILDHGYIGGHGLVGAPLLGLGHGWH